MSDNSSMVVLTVAVLTFLGCTMVFSDCSCDPTGISTCAKACAKTGQGMQSYESRTNNCVCQPKNP